VRGFDKTFFCSACEKTVGPGSTSISCNPDPITTLHGSTQKVPYDGRSGIQCKECGIIIGQYHHFGCSNELCKVTGKTFDECGCRHIKIEIDRLTKLIDDVKVQQSTNHKFYEMLCDILPMFDRADRYAEEGDMESIKVSLSLFRNVITNTTKFMGVNSEMMKGLTKNLIPLKVSEK
jgi:hypothetical protein